MMNDIKSNKKNIKHQHTTIFSSELNVKNTVKTVQFLPHFNYIIFSLLTIFSIINTCNAGSNENIPTKIELKKSAEDCTAWLKTFDSINANEQKDILLGRILDKSIKVQTKTNTKSLISNEYTLQWLSFSATNDHYILAATNADKSVISGEIFINWQTNIDVIATDIKYPYVVKLRCDKYCTQSQLQSDKDIGKDHHQFMDIHFETELDLNTFVCTMQLIKKMDELKHTRIDCASTFWSKSEDEKLKYYKKWNANWQKRLRKASFISHIFDSKMFWDPKNIRFSSISDKNKKRNVIEVQSAKKSKKKLIRKQINYRTTIIARTVAAKANSFIDGSQIYRVKLKFKPKKTDVNVGGFGSNSMMFKTSDKAERDMFVCAVRDIKFSCIQEEYASADGGQKISADFRMIDGKLDLKEVAELFKNVDADDPIYGLLKEYKKVLSTLKWQRRSHILITIAGKAVDFGMIIYQLIFGDVDGIFEVINLLVDIEDSTRKAFDSVNEVNAKYEDYSITTRIFMSLGQLVEEMLTTLTAMQGQKFAELSPYQRFKVIKRYLRVMSLTVTAIVPPSAPITGIILITVASVDIVWHLTRSVLAIFKGKNRDIIKKTFGKIKSIILKRTNEESGSLIFADKKKGYKEAAEIAAGVLESCSNAKPVPEDKDTGKVYQI